jgi:O-antigen ligase
MLWILIGYMFLFVHRPFEVWPVLGEIHLERFYMIAALLAGAIAPGKRWLANWQHVALLGFAAAVVLCWLASPWSDVGEQTVENYFKVLVFYLLIVLLVHDERGLRRLLLGFLGVMFVYMAHSLWEYAHGRHVYRMGICRLIGIDKTMGDPNTFGASVVYALPLVVPFWLCRPSGPLRAFLVAYVGLSTVCIGLTGSRSSLLGLLINLAVVMLRSRHRKRAVLLGVLALPLLWWALPESLQQRFHTIIDPSVGPKNAQDSAEGRLVGFYNGLAVYGRFPLTGCGPGAWKPATRTDTESHCLYGQILGEMGTVGALAFLGVLAGFAWNLWQIRKAYRQHLEWGYDFPYQVAVALGLAVLLLLFEGIGGHNLFRYSWLWYGGFLIIARHCVEQRLACAWGTVPRFTPRPAWARPRLAFGRGAV